MSLVHQSRSGQAVHDLFTPETSQPIMGRSAAPPPFQLIASSGRAGLGEESESEALIPEQVEESQSHIAADDNPASGSGGSDGGSSSDGSGNDDSVETGPDLATQLSGKEGGEVLPELLRTNIQTLSGHDLSDVRVNYNSTKPKLLGAGAYARGNQIELAAGQEKHLNTAAWAIVQQREGRVSPTLSEKGVAVNDDTTLEKEAALKGAKLLGMRSKLMRLHRQNIRALTEAIEAQQAQSIVVVPGSFRVIEEDEDGTIVEPVAEEIDTEPFAPAIPENTLDAGIR